MKLSSITQSNVKCVNALKNDSSDESNSKNVNFKGISANNILNAMDMHSAANKAQVSFCGDSSGTCEVPHYIGTIQGMPQKGSLEEMEKIEKELPYWLYFMLTSPDRRMIPIDSNPPEKPTVKTGTSADYGTTKSEQMADAKKVKTLTTFLNGVSTNCITDENIIEGFINTLTGIKNENERFKILQRLDKAPLIMLFDYDCNVIGSEKVAGNVQDGKPEGKNAITYSTVKVIDSFSDEKRPEVARYVFGAFYDYLGSKNSPIDEKIMDDYGGSLLSCLKGEVKEPEESKPIV